MIPKTFLFTDYALQTWAVRFEAYTLLKVMTDLKLESKYFQDRGGYKILHLAALGGHIDIIETVLKDNKMEIDEKTANKDSAIHLASLQDNSIVVDLLLKHNEKLKKDDREAKLKLNSKFVDLNVDGMTPMHVAAANGNKSVLKILFDAYISNKRKSSQDSMFNQKKIMKDMLGIKDSSGKSILHQGQSFLEITRLILHHGNDVLFECDQNERYQQLINYILF